MVAPEAVTMAAQHLDDAEWELDRWQRSSVECPFSDWYSEVYPDAPTSSRAVEWGVEFLDGSALELVGDARDGQMEVMGIDEVSGKSYALFPQCKHPMWNIRQYTSCPKCGTHPVRIYHDPQMYGAKR